jgi:transcriptional antiterminator NusG
MADNTQNRDKQWYVINTYSGRERNVRDNLLTRIETLDMQDYIFQVLVAEHEETITRQTKKGPKTEKKLKNTYPGYVFVEMIMTNDAWFVVRNTPDVTGFVGSSGKGTKPFPVPKEQIEPVLKRLGIIDDTMFSDYQVDDRVRVLLGNFVGTIGEIKSVDTHLRTVDIQTVFFGRSSSVLGISFDDIEKL